VVIRAGVWNLSYAGEIRFTGSFSGDVLWQLLNNGSREYTLTGPISGTLVEGNQNIAVVGLTVQLTVTIGKNNQVVDWRSILIASGNTTLTPVVPEPSTLGLLGTGLVAVAALVRYRLRSR
jgi:PEP-CTERM motif-containing protein